MIRRPLTARLATTITAGLTGGVLLLTGCSTQSPLGTQVEYDPSDGVGADLGDLYLRNVLVVSDGDGAPGVLSGAVTNRGSEAAQLTLTALDATTQTADPASPTDPELGAPFSAELEIPAGGTVRLGTSDGAERIVLPAVEAAPGSLLPMTASSPADGDTSLGVPVLIAQREYAELTPPPEPIRGPGGLFPTEEPTAAEEFAPDGTIPEGVIPEGSTESTAAEPTTAAPTGAAPTP